MMTAGIILIVIFAIFGFILFFVITPRLMTSTLEVKADTLENGVYIPNNSFAKKVISFYTKTEDSLRITFFMHIVYAEICVVSISEKGHKSVRRYAISPSDENTIQIPYVSKDEYMAIFVNKANNEPYSSSYPVVSKINGHSYLVSLLATVVTYLIGTGVVFIFRSMYNIYNLILPMHLVIAGISIASFFIVAACLRNRYKALALGGCLDD